jgi:cytochrome c oxidase subunit 1/cytochrome c oxidase subunit I+III
VENDTYFVVAHIHYVLFGGTILGLLAGIYYWFPKVTGRMYHEGVGKLSFWMTFVGTLVTFFPMHIVGILGMPRRNYTYPPGLGWTFLNALETVGAYVLGAGLVLIVANLALSLVKGERVGNDPWGGDTLEWATTSPPPPYNYAVIPTVSSPYAMWDREDREQDLRKLDRGEDLLERGHETPASTVQDADYDEILAMPPHSAWPPVAGLTLTGVFAMLLLHHFEIAAGFLVLGAIVLLRWHAPEAGA